MAHEQMSDDEKMELIRKISESVMNEIQSGRDPNDSDFAANATLRLKMDYLSDLQLEHAINTGWGVLERTSTKLLLMVLYTAGSGALTAAGIPVQDIENSVRDAAHLLILLFEQRRREAHELSKKVGNE